MNPKRFSSSTRPSTSVKSRFTCGFLRALWRINRQRRTTSASSREICRRYLRVKVAADVSMASAVGSRRAWSRAILLRKLRNKGQNGTVRVRRMSNILGMRKRNICGNKCTEELGTCQAEQLRKLVPGGEEMDMCNLLGETAHYIECLTTQVKVMRRIAEILST
ncbi:hypothetical protein I3843_13G046600 [Carya illinoinensis]|uniref:IBH1-like N-terminal domain-containing protein n=1 Tax=Carya illinoinensis TaxID=32201 RepID=A0A8T1NMW1_CARIL|nr:transcription factor IBH1-like [Carya illinoinensis]KAG2672677.1 hypothetical protein I3760_13G053800 [Carya illinoinensis]KAG6630932.1 hypothetical protein CIPAW_13G055500 [Carya illinoinensis]KAG6680686.1 hypothetical protein I3842_13G055100 [Carya illinoinensis]KAG7949149.1 hypothetical protein I3843_13G046600 [Carya illinoinensis]